MSRLRRHNAPAGIADASEEEIHHRLESIRVGIWLTLIVSLGGLVYCLATLDQPNRPAIIAISVLAFMTGVAMHWLPAEKVVRGQWRERFFVSWTVTDILMIATIVALDGGTRSPFALLFALPFLFGSLSYPLRLTVLVGVLSIAAYLTVAIAVGGGLLYSSLGVFTILCVALMSSWESNNQAQRRLNLAETAAARKRSEESSRLQAEQQFEVARFGQTALAGQDLESLRGEACELINRMLETEICGVLELEPDGENFLITGADGMPPDVVGEARVPIGRDSQAGYVLETEQPLLVHDWENETRCQQSWILAELGMKSGATVLIKAQDQAIGVLGAHTTSIREFSDSDVSFLEAIANVLATGIERRRTEEQTQHAALHDPLTDLPNRSLFLDRLAHALSGASRRGSSIAVLFLDLDQFKLVNDSLGHAAGDDLLSAVAPRIEGALRPGDTVARFGGDEFAILAEEIEDEHGATRVAERIAEVLTKPFVLRGREHFVSASIGISLGTGREDPETLIRDADAALYRAKDRGRGGYEIFDEVMRSRVIEHMQTENDLRRALQRQEFELHYQPLIRLRDESIAAIEALLRWNHPTRGMIPPLGFIPVAEETRLILPIGRWVIEEACRQAAEWQALEPDRAPINVHVNLSARQLSDPGLVRHLEDTIRDTGIDPSCLRLELTESILLDDTDSVERCMASLKKLGVGIVLDDFGVGFSSLGYLRRFPLTSVKLDRSFVENITESENDAAIVRAVSEMADAIGFGVVAEGIETAEQAQAARDLGCGFAQGFHFSLPLPAAEAGALLAGSARVPLSS